MSRTSFLVAGVIFILSACNGGSAGSIGSTTAITSEQKLVSYLDASTYQSIEEYEAGLGEMGVVMGYWTIAFDEDTFVWDYSDLSVGGSYSYVSETAFLVQLSNSSFLAEIEFEEDELIWDSIRYEKIVE